MLENVVKNEKDATSKDFVVYVNQKSNKNIMCYL